MTVTGVHLHMDGIPDVAEQQRANVDRPNEQGRGVGSSVTVQVPLTCHFSTCPLSGRPSEVQWSVCTRATSIGLYSAEKFGHINLWREVFEGKSSRSDSLSVLSVQTERSVRQHLVQDSICDTPPRIQGQVRRRTCLCAMSAGTVESMIEQFGVWFPFGFIEDSGIGMTNMSL